MAGLRGGAPAAGAGQQPVRRLQRDLGAEP
jgi:hypothetical protein